jgi:rfaE bifunctional protein nucleotidyltransferase chain/domain
MIISLEEFLPVRKDLKTEGLKLVFTNGCFDILHRGHIAYLNEAKKLGDVLLIGLNSDNSVKELKGNDRPVNSQSDRAFILNDLKPVDYVIIFDEDTPYELIRQVIPDVLVKGGDWKEEDIVGADIVKSNGGKVVSLKFINDYSTSKIIEKISGFKQD